MSMKRKSRHSSPYAFSFPQDAERCRKMQENVVAPDCPSPAPDSPQNFPGKYIEHTGTGLTQL